MSRLNGKRSSCSTEENKSFRGQTVRLDGKSFSNCRFENCVLIYSGERCEWEDTSFFNCQIVFDGPANNTVQFLRGIGLSFEMRGEILAQ